MNSMEVNLMGRYCSLKRERHEILLSSSPGYTYGCKYYGFTRSINSDEDFSSSFRIQPHRMGYLKREKGQSPILELNYPGRFNLQTWFADADHNLISPVSEEIYEVINVTPK